MLSGPDISGSLKEETYVPNLKSTKVNPSCGLSNTSMVNANKLVPTLPNRSYLLSSKNTTMFRTTKL